MKTRIALLACLAVMATTCGSLEAQPPSGQLGARPRPLTEILKTSPVDGAMDVLLDSNAEVFFSQPIDPNTVSAESFIVTADGELLEVQLTTSLDRRRVIISCPGFLPGDVDVEVMVNGSVLRDISGRFVDADGDQAAGGVLTFSFHTSAALPIPVETGSALITGYVYQVDEATGALFPAFGASATAVAYPATNGAPVLGTATTGADGYFELTTAPFTASMTFLVGVSVMNHTESQHIVTILPGRCWRVEDSILNPLSPPVFVEASEGGVVIDPGDNVELEIPAGALGEDSVIQVTLLDSAGALRTQLPEMTAPSGTYVDVAGVFGEVTSVPVILRVPNTYNLPLGTEVPFGKVDHFTLEWSDLRELYTGPGDPPDAFLGLVIDDGSGGTVIEVQFDSFCNVCTSHCLPFPDPPTPVPPGEAPVPPPCGGGPGSSPGSSVITHHEGHLYETIRLPGFLERGREFSLSLGYNSSGAYPSLTLAATVDYDTTRPVERTQYEISVEGLQILAAYDFSENNLKHHGKYIWHGVDGIGQQLPTGAYFYQIHVTSLNANTAVALPQFFGDGGTGPDITIFTGIEYPGLVPQRSFLSEGRAVLLNNTESPYGAGWSIEQEKRLHFDPDGCVVLVEGNGALNLFAPDPDQENEWVSPARDFSRLTLNPVDGSIQRVQRDGSTELYDANGFLQSIQDRFGQTTMFSYVGGLLTAVTSPTGFQYDLEYVGGRLSRIADSAGSETLFTVDMAGDLVAITDAMTATRTFTYDSDHLLIEQQGPRGERSEYDYINGRVVAARNYDTDGITVIRERFFSPGVLQGEIGTALAAGLGTLTNPIPVVSEATDLITDGRGVTTTQETDYLGRVIRSVDGLGRETLYEYGLDSLVRAVEWPDGSRIELDYDDAGHPIARHERDPGGVLYGSTFMEYEPTFGQLAKITDAEGKETEFVHDTLGRISSVIDHLGRQRDQMYEDPLHPSLVTTIELPDGFSEVVSYDIHGNLAVILDAIGRQTDFTHSSTHGRLEQIVDGNMNATVFTHDALGRIESVVGGPSVATQFDYGNDDCACSTANLTRVTFANGTFIQHEYDGLGRRVETIDQLGASIVFQYDPESHVTARINREGENLSMTYDDAGQLTLREAAGGEVEFFEYDARGRVIEAQNSHTLIQLTRDFLGRVTQHAAVVSIPGLAVPRVSVLDYEYDLVGNVTAMLSEHGTYAYTHDDLHRTMQITDPWLQTFSYTYDALGRRSSLTRSNGTVTEYEYDLVGQLLSASHGDGLGSSFLSHTYGEYDGIGNLTAETRSSPLGTTTRGHEYDGFQRLTASTADSPDGDVQSDVISSHDLANRLLSDGVSTFTHDAEGRLTTEIGVGITTTYEYEAQGRLLGLNQEAAAQTVLETTYLYDPFGRRIAKGVNDVWTLYEYDGDRVFQVLDGRGIPLWVFSHGPRRDEPLVVRDLATDQSYFYHQDRLGSVSGLTDATGTLVQEYLYDEFGNPILTTSAPLYQPYRFTGREWDRETGLYFYRSRYYHPEHGRFLTEDPIRLAGGANFYAYVSNNPVNLVDPDGLQEENKDNPEGPFTPPQTTDSPAPNPDPLGALCVTVGGVKLCPGSTPSAPGVDGSFPKTGGVVAKFPIGPFSGKAGAGIGAPNLDDLSKTPFACGVSITF